MRVNALVLSISICAISASTAYPPQTIRIAIPNSKLGLSSKPFSSPLLNLRISDSNPGISLEETHLIRPHKPGTDLIAAGMLVIPLDQKIRNSLPRIDPDQPCDRLTEKISNLGTPRFLLPMIGGMYLLGNHNSKVTAEKAFRALITAGIATQGLKLSIRRGRPALAQGAGEFSGHVSEAKHDSFPSGHTSAAFAVAGVLAKRDSSRNWFYYLLASSVGYSRVRKNAHFPSDVLVGAGLGIRAANPDDVQEIVTFTKQF